MNAMKKKTERREMDQERPRPGQAMEPSKGDMAYKKMKSSYQKFASSVDWPVSVLGNGWKASKDLFDPRKAGPVFKEKSGSSDFRAGFLIFLCSAILCALIIFTGVMTQAYLQAYTYQEVRQKGGFDVNSTVMSQLNPALMAMILFIPLSLLFTLVLEGLVFALAKISGGKGSFSNQFYLSSLVGLARAAMTMILLLGAVYCAGAIVAVIYLILLAYFLIYVTPKAYATAHSINFFHALIITILSYAIPIGLLLLLHAQALTYGIAAIA
jgi:hypothetical protein